MAWIIVAVGAIFLGCVLSIADLHRFMGTSMTGQANFIRLVAGYVEYLSAFFAVAIDAFRNIAVPDVAVHTIQLTMFAGEFL